MAGRRRSTSLFGAWCFRLLLLGLCSSRRRGVSWVRWGVVSVGCLVVVSWRGCCFVDVVRGFDFRPPAVLAHEIFTEGDSRDSLLRTNVHSRPF